MKTAGEEVWKEIAESNGLVKRMGDAYERAILGSFTLDGARMTQRELTRRTKIVTEHMCMLRRDMKWSFPRIMDELPRALRCVLDRIPYEPSRSRHWQAPDRGELD